MAVRIAGSKPETKPDMEVSLEGDCFGVVVRVRRGSMSQAVVRIREDAPLDLISLFDDVGIPFDKKSHKPEFVFT